MEKSEKKIKEGMLLAWGELFLKSEGVQEGLKKRLVRNLNLFLKKQGVDFKIFQLRERIFIETKNARKAARVLKNTFGLVWFSKAIFLRNYSLKDLEVFIQENYKDWVKRGESFALRVKRSPEIKEKREEIINRVAKHIKRKVNLDHPQKEIFIEARKEGWFVYFKKSACSGGLPVGNQGKVLTLLSGGIDSPAAAWLMAKRGAENVWLHFHSFPLVSRASIEKVKELAAVFLDYQPRLKVYFIPFSEIQMAIKTSVPAKYRVLFYRRLMFKIAEILAKQEKCQALVTGESLGQVSSQTLPNLRITQEGLKIPILRPLIGMDKQEIISLAERINTLEISIKPQEDCCTLFISKHQTAAGNIETVRKLEKDLRLDQLITEAIQKAELENF